MGGGALEGLTVTHYTGNNPKEVMQHDLSLIQLFLKTCISDI